MPTFYARAAIILSILTPVAAIASRSSSAVVFYAFVALSLAALAHNGLRRFPGTAPAYPWLVAFALAAPLVSIAVTDMHVYGLRGSELEKGLRFALALPVLWLLIRVPARSLRQLQWGLIAAACIASLMIIVNVLLTHTDDPRAVIAQIGAHYNAVTAANLTLLFGVSALMTLPWTLSAWPSAERIVKILAFVLSVVATLLSGTRSSWMLLPICLLSLFLGREMKARTRLAWLVGGVLVLALAGVALYEVNQRFLEIASDVQQFDNGHLKDTSVGIRMQLWQAALHIFREHPWLGIGLANFRDALHDLAAQGVITQFVAENFGEPHNDLLGALAGYGLLGLVSMMALYWLPAAWFYRRLQTVSPDMRAAVRIGLLLCLGYTAFSLTEMMFRNMRSVPIYSTMVVILMAASRARTQEVNQDVPELDGQGFAK